MLDGSGAARPRRPTAVPSRRGRVAQRDQLLRVRGGCEVEDRFGSEAKATCDRLRRRRIGRMATSRIRRTLEDHARHRAGDRHSAPPSTRTGKSGHSERPPRPGRKEWAAPTWAPLCLTGDDHRNCRDYGRATYLEKLMRRRWPRRHLQPLRRLCPTGRGQRPRRHPDASRWGMTSTSNEAARSEQP